MMMSKGCLSVESEERLKGYVDANILDAEQFLNILYARDYEGIVAAVDVFIGIDDSRRVLIWNFVIHNYWRLDVNNVFVKNEIIFFTELLLNRGVLSREVLCKRVFRSKDASDRAAKSLIERGVVDKFMLRNFEVMYVLSLNFFNKIFGGLK